MSAKTSIASELRSMAEQINKQASTWPKRTALASAHAAASEASAILEDAATELVPPLKAT